MTKAPILNNEQNTQYLILLILSIVVLGIIGLLDHTESLIFRRFIGGFNPTVLSLFIIIIGLVLSFILLSKSWFFIYKRESIKGFLHYFWLAILLSSIAILIDWKIKFPADMNVPFPESLLFYPAIGFLAEIIFHLLPLSILLLLLSAIFNNRKANRLIWFCIFLVATIEPTYQILPMDGYPAWSVLATWTNLYIFNLAQLYVFKKYDFTSMYAFRLVYYLIWHIVWGQMRLEWLF